jgi:HlyD family secretion protein
VDVRTLQRDVKRGPRSVKRKWVALTIAAAVIVVAVAVLFVTEREESASILTAGTVQGPEVNIASVVSGKIIWECCEEGDKIDRDTILVQLENEDLKASVVRAEATVERAKADVTVATSVIESAKANLISAEADVVNAEADVEKAKAELDEAKRDLDRWETLYHKDVVSKATYDSVATKYETALASYSSSKAKLSAAGSKKEAAAAQVKTVENQLISARAALKEAEATLEFNRAKMAETTLRSPISGTIVFKAFEVGETISAGTSIMTVVDLERLFVRVDLEETVIDRVAIDDKAVIWIQGAAHEKYHGRVTEIRQIGEFATQKDVTRGRQDIQTFRVKVALEDTETRLKPGMTVKVEIPVKKAK